MSKFIVMQFVIGLVTSVIGGLIVYFITRRRIVSLLAFLGILIGASLLIIQYSRLKPPYEVTGVQWQIDRHNMIWVYGKVFNKETGRPKPGKVIQVKIFEAGKDTPFKGPSFPKTSIDGRFTINFQPPPPKANTLYIINTAYKYNDNRWEIKDFEVSFIPTHAETSIGDFFLKISEPNNGQEVSVREWVRGKLSDTSYEVYILIHPMATVSWWVQPLPSINSDGTWEAYCFFGEETVGIGESFEIIAIATKEKGVLRSGQQLPIDKIPTDAIRSPIVRVIRRQ